MIVLVTGSAGFIGQYTMRALEDRGYIPLPFDLADGHDVLNRDVVMDHVGQADAVIHLSGVLGTHELYDDAHKAIDVNIKGAVNVLDACAQWGNPFVMIEQPHIWYNPYEATKAAAHRFAMAYHLDKDVPVAFVETYNAYGPGQAHGKGHPQKILPTFAVNAWRNLPIPIWGDGEQVIDLIAAPDVADCLVDAVEGPLLANNYVAGTGVPVTVNEAAEVILDAVSAFSEGEAGQAGVKRRPMRRGENTEEPAVAPYCNYPMRWGYLMETVLSYRNHPVD